MQGGISIPSVLAVTFLVGEWRTGAGGMGGTRDLCVDLKRGGDMGSRCTSTMRMTTLLCSRIDACPCCDGVYRMYWVSALFQHNETGMQHNLLCVMFQGLPGLFSNLLDVILTGLFAILCNQPIDVYLWRMMDIDCNAENR